MKAFVKTKYGGPEVLQLEEVELPTLKDDHLLVKVYATAANPADWHLLRGKPFFARFTSGLFKPKEKIPGADFAGIVVAKGSSLTSFEVGDHVVGGTLLGGAFAEFISVPASICARFSKEISFEQMASLPIAGLTAFQALLTHGKRKQGETVLINGAAGGVGHFAVQIAKAYGAIVTGVCSGRNADFVKSLGADKVIPYDTENIHLHNGKYDLVLDVNGNLTHEDFNRMGRRGVLIGFTTMKHMFSTLFRKAFSKFPLIQFTVTVNTADLQTLATMVEEGKIKPQIEKIFSSSEIPEAIGYIEAMRTRGKVVMKWLDDLIG
ncbi:NAD(P)-dependent alcohol dehydrogenase [Flavihumibacter cheonanensis]|uniref:NAD(P)-dependent alcohol dehydrogenase n=1 Tax=Flavihumibacter cheonanensis TaxID=1442385 RepID=UPI001EF85E24|nr:NAD(P)-dependent alcohol dehydrogenase [Flavihumibacter cheonanensis]MCG7754332.1 NAD(P)-dependent alcohol dehydrogenase [Flavihumibacter cheonanensis]